MQHGKMDSVQIRNIEALTQFDKFMDELTRQMVGCHSLITPMTGHVKYHLKKTEEEGRLAQRLQQQFLKANYQPQRAMPRWKLE